MYTNIPIKTKNFKFYLLFLCIFLFAYSLAFIEEFFSIDDSFFYYSTAVNSDSFFLTTYDGFTYTNGYQPLWMLVTYVAYSIVNTIGLQDYFLNVILFINLSFLFGFMVIFRKLLIDFDINLPKSPYELYFLILFSPIIFIHPVLNSFFIFGGGIEFQLTLFLFVLWIRNAIKLSEVSVIRLAFLTILLILARLDSAVILAPYFIYYSLVNRKKRVFISGILVFIVISLWLIFNHITYGSLMPISGEIKSLWGSYNTNAGSFIERVKDLILAWLPISRIFINGEYVIPVIRIIKTLLVFFIFGYLLRELVLNKNFKTHIQIIMKKFEGFLYLLCIGFLLFIGYLSSHLFTETKFWYYSFFYILIGILFSSLIFRREYLLIKKIFITYSLLTLLEFGLYAIDTPSINQNAQKRDILKEVEEFAGNRRLVTPNSGYYGWISNNTLSNMDGLMSDKDYFNQLSNNTIARYWSDKNVVIFIKKSYLEKWPYQFILFEFNCVELTTDNTIIVCE